MFNVCDSGILRPHPRFGRLLWFVRGCTYIRNTRLLNRIGAVWTLWASGTRRTLTANATRTTNATTLCGCGGLSDCLLTHHHISKVILYVCEHLMLAFIRKFLEFVCGR